MHSYGIDSTEAQKISSALWSHFILIVVHSSLIFVGEGSCMQIEFPTTSHKCLIRFMLGEHGHDTIHWNFVPSGQIQENGKWKILLYQSLKYKRFVCIRNRYLIFWLSFELKYCLLALEICSYLRHEADSKKWHKIVLLSTNQPKGFISLFDVYLFQVFLMVKLFPYLFQYQDTFLILE